MTILSRYVHLIRYSLGQWPALSWVLGFTVSLSAVTALQPWPMKILVDYALGDVAVPTSLTALLTQGSLAPTPTTLIVLAALASLGLFALNASLDAALTWTWAGAGQRSVYALATDLFERLQRLSWLFHNRRSVGDSLSRLSGDSYCAYTVADALLISPGRQLFTLATIGVVAWNMDPTLTLISLAVAPIMAGSALIFGPRLKRRGQRNRAIQSQLMSFVHQTLTAIPVVQAFGTEERNRRRFEGLAAQAVTHSQRGNLVNNAYTLVNGLVTTTGTAIVLFAGGQRVLAGAMSLGSLLVFLAYLQSMHTAFRGLLGIYGRLKSAEASMERAFEILEMEPAVREAPEARPVPILPPGQRGHVRLERVSFGYEPNQPVLHDISLEARPGQTVALVGATGAGKSTLAALIPRFFDPWEGRITFDGVDLRELRLASLRDQIALVLQEPFLLPLTVAENIAYGRPEASREAIQAAARDANAEEFILPLPQGYDTVIGERGATLSGGQRQRLAIARALLKDAPVLILDEPTAALDAHTEALLLEALERLMAGRTTFIVTHRLSTIRRADQILVLGQGRILQTGTHQELLAAGGHYRRLHSLQHGAVLGADE